MATTRVYVSQLNKGLDTNIATSMVDDKSAVDLLNVRWNEGGVVTKRDGFQTWGVNLTVPKALGRLATSSKREVLAMDDSTLKATQTGDSWTSIGPSSGTITFTTTAEDYSIQQIKTKAYVWNRTDPGTVYDGTHISRPGTIPKAGFSEYYKGYHVCAGVPGQESRIYFSTLANTSDFTNDPAATTDGPDPDNATEVPGATVFTGTTPDVAQFVDVSPSDGDSITLLKEFQDFLIIGKEHSLWSMTLDATTQKPVIQLISRAVGCVSPKSATAVNNDLYFLSEYGPLSLGNERNYLGNLRTNLLAEHIKSMMDSINPAQWNRAVSVYWDRMWIISVPYENSTTNNRVFMYDTRWSAWAVWDNIDARSWLMHIDSENKSHLFFVKEGSNHVSEMIPRFYYDESDAIIAYWRSKAVDAGALDVTKRWTYFTLFMRNIGARADVTISTELEQLEPVNIFEESAPTAIGFRRWGVNSWLGPVSDSLSGDNTSLSTSDDAWRTQPNLEARTFTFEVRNDRAGESFFLAGFSLEYVTLKAYYFDQSHTF